MTHATLAFSWLGIIAFGIIMYVLLDGFSLGIGILFPLAKNSYQRDIMLSTVIPVWDGNETWLVFGGATLYGAFPTAFALLLPIFYLPIILMVIALLLRGVVFEFYHKAHRSQVIWNWVFFIASVVATLAQGMILGRFLQGFDQFNTLSAYTWLTPYSVFTAIAVVFGYILLGSTWLIAKTVDDLQQQMRHVAQVALIVVALCLLIVSIWSPFLKQTIFNRWFDWDNWYMLAVLPLFAGIAIVINFLLLRRHHDMWPFYLSMAIFIFSYIGVGYSVWPYIVPYQVSYIDAAAPASTLRFMLVGAVIMLPILLAYTFYAYRIFKGKVTDVLHY